MLVSKEHFKTIKLKAYRIVEDQSKTYTRKLVDSHEEHKILEDIIESHKPPYPTKNSKGTLDILLYTPFRYPPLIGGTRFGRPFEQSIFYASYDLKTSMAEIAYHRFLFLENITDYERLEPQIIHLTWFKIGVYTKLGIDLTSPPFDTHTEEISHLTSYETSQSLGTSMREAGAEAFTYFSARKANGRNIGVFSVEAFTANKPEKTGSISAYITNDVIEMNNTQDDSTILFKKEYFSK